MFDGVFKIVEPMIAKLPIVCTTRQTIPVMLLLAMFAKVLQVLLSLVATSGYDNVNASYKKGIVNGSPSASARLCHRAYLAHCNSLEAFMMFSAAILLALFSDQDTTELTTLANAFVWIRFVYIFVYIVADNNFLAMIRGAVFTSGFVIILRIFTMAAGELEFPAGLLG